MEKRRGPRTKNWDIPTLKSRGKKRKSRGKKRNQQRIGKRVIVVVRNLYYPKTREKQLFPGERDDQICQMLPIGQVK